MYEDVGRVPYLITQYKYPKKEGRNIAERGLSLDLAERLDWATALIWQDRRKNYGERRYCVLGLIEDRLHSVFYPARRQASGHQSA